MAFVPDPLLTNIAFLLFSLILIFKAADLIVYGISRYARELRLSDYLIGFVVVALAASMPEVIASITGLFAGREDVLFGTILGTNMVHLALVLGTLSVLGGRMSVACRILKGRLFAVWLMVLLPFALILWDGVLGRVDGVILVSAFLVWLVGLWWREGTVGTVKRTVRLTRIWRDSFIFLGSLIALILAGRFLVFSSINIAALVGIPAYFIAITIISVSGAIPDFAVGIRSVLKGHQDIGIGDIIGSVVLELLLFFGIVGIVNPIRVPFAVVVNAAVFLILSLSFVLWVMRREWMTRRHGFVLLALYAAFLTIEVLKLVR